MKKINFRTLLVLIGVLITSFTTQVWAWYYITGDPVGGWQYNNPSGGQMNSDNNITFMAMAKGTYYFKLYCDGWGQPCGSINSASGTAYDSSGKQSGDCGAMWVKTTDVANITFQVVNTNQVQITVTKCAYYIKYKWNGGSQSWSGDMKSNGDGTYSVMGQYGGTSNFKYGRKNSDGGSDYSSSDQTATVVGSPSTGEYCVFTYTPSTHSLEIRKCNSIAATNYIYFDNDNAKWNQTYMYFVIGRPYKTSNKYSKMYRIQQITNTNLWYGTNGDSWDDATYYAIAGGSSAWDNNTDWNYSSLGGWTKRSAPYLGNYNMSSGYNYIVGKENGNNDEAISITKTGNAYSSLNSLTVGYKYVVDGSDMASGGAPAQITMNSYVFNAHSTVTGNAAQTINANASGTYSKSITAAYRGKVVLTQSNLSDGYKFIGWYNGNTRKETANSYTYYPNANTTISAKYEYRWTLKGTFPYETEWEEDHYISNFSINASSEDVGYLDIDLPGNTSFQFKVVDRTNNTWHSCSGTSEGSEYNFTYLSDKEKDCSACTGSEKNMIFNTAAPGTYRFTWNADTKTLTVTYPASYKVTYDGNDKTSGTVPTDNDYYAANATVTVKGNGGSLTKTGYNTLAYWNTENDGSGTDIAISTGTFSITDNTTLYAKWTQGVTLHDNNGAAHNGSTTVNWNAAGPFSITAPTRDHYSVEGYYAEVGCTNKVLTAAGAIAASSVVDGSSVTFISGSKWAHPAATTLYTKWTEDEYTVTTSSGTGGSVDEDSYTAYVATTTAISATPATGYKFLSWEVVSGSVTFADQYSASTTMNATSDAEIKANFVYRWSIAGTWKYYDESDTEDADTYAMGNITKDGNDDVCSIGITLPANTNYTFKVVDRAASPYNWWGNSNDGSAPFYMTYGNSTDWGFRDDYSKACGITTAGAGTYTFTWNISDKQLTVTYPTSYYVTAAGNPATGGTVTPSSATYMSTSVGGEITATPNYSHYFNGWTSSAGGTFTSASSATTTFKPASAAATVTAAFAERTAFIEGNFQVYNSSRGTRTATGESWQDASTAIQMTYDAVNNRYYLHTYSTPAELAEQLNSADAYFYIKTSTSSSSIADAVMYRAYSSTVQSLTAYGESNKKATGSTEHSFKFTGSEDGYVIIYFNGTHVWYELECALSYYGGDGATGDAPAARTFYAYNSSQTAASNTYSKTGYTFANWNTASGGGGTTYAAGATNVAMDAHEVCLHAMWTINNHDITYTAPSHGTYTIKAGDASAVSTNVADVDYATTITLAATPATGYSFAGWTVTGATAADASSANTTFSMPDNDVTVAATFSAQNYTVTLNDNGGSGGSGSKSVTYNATTNLTSNVTVPIKSGYTFGGYFINNDGTGSQLITNTGAWIKDVTDYTGSSSTNPTWVYADNLTIYAKWTQDIILDDNGTGSDYLGNGSAAAIYNNAGAFTISTTPRRTGYVVEGYYAEPACTHKVMTAAGALVDYTGYVVSGKWVHSDATTLYTKWSEDAFTVTINAGEHGSVSTSSVTNAKPETASSSFTVTADAGYAFSHWTYSVANVATANYESTGGTNNATQTFTVNAKAAVTITANYVVRYGLYGSLDDAPTNTPAGMPGWTVSEDFTYNTGVSPYYTLDVDLTKPNTNYKFRILDRRDNYSWGLSSKAVIGEKTTTTLNSGNADALLSTAGVGEYSFTVTEADEGAHPAVYIENPSSHLVTYGVVGSGGSISSVVDGEATPNEISSGQYIKDGGTLAFTHSAASTGYSFAGWYKESTCENAYVNGEDNATIDGSTLTLSSIGGAVTVYAKFEAATYNGTLEGVDGSDGTYRVVYGATSLTETSAPSRSGYHAYRYYLTYDEGEYSNYIAESSATTSKALRPGVSISTTDYTNSNGEWIYEGNPTIYVKWEEDTYTITLDKSLPSGTTGVAGDNNFTVSYNNNNYSFGDNLSSRPVAEGYTFAGYYTDDVSPVLVIKADGSINTATAYVSGIGKWQHAGNVTLYAHWTDDHHYYYKGATADGWSTASNWTKGAVPASDGSNTIHILKPLVISSDKKVAAVDIITSGTYTPTGGSAIDASGKLTINPNVGLNVTGTVTRTADATSNLATREGDLVLESSSTGNASLIFDNSYSCQATVQMYSKASISGSTWNWQYVGTPFTGSIPLYNYYGSWMYKWNNGGWDVVKGSDELTPFAGYCLTQESATTHVMGGTLVPTTSKSVTMSASTDMVLANSWTAPIYIGGFTSSTFTSRPATIYLFNTGMATKESGGASAGTEAGTYETVPVNAAPYSGDEFIAPMQGFFVTTNGDGGAAGTITMNYDALVRPSGSHTDIVAGPMKAPKRAQAADDKPAVLKIWANGFKYNDRVVILEREDFSEGFDNGWDGTKMSFGVASPSVYVINAQGGYDAVSAIPNLEGTVIGFRAGEDKVCTMTFDYNGEEIWYLNDLQEQRSTEINSEINYQFTTSAGDSEVRFIVSKTPINHMPTGIEEISDQNSVVRKQMIDDKLYIIRSGRIYSAQGALVK